jgi:hypothetical protein
MQTFTPSLSPINLPGGGLETMGHEKLLCHYKERLIDMMRMSQGSLPTQDYRNKIFPAIENRTSAVSWMKEVRFLPKTIATFHGYNFKARH